MTTRPIQRTSRSGAPRRTSEEAFARGRTTRCARLKPAERGRDWDGRGPVVSDQVCICCTGQFVAGFYLRAHDSLILNPSGMKPGDQNSHK